MKKLAWFVFIPVLLAVPFDSLDACTIFMASRGELTLVGNNEDWKDPDTKVWVARIFIQSFDGEDYAQKVD